MDAISSINSRISYIESQLAALRTGGVPVREATTSTAFAQALASVGLGAGKAQLNADGVPADLAAYGNGRIPAGALAQVGETRHRLWAPAADSLTRLMLDARRDGVAIGITDSYRSYAEQVDLAKRKGLHSQGGLAAKPGTSDHGWGMAVDLDLDSRAQAWMRANGAKYGFVENTPREPWHWAYRPGNYGVQPSNGS